MNICTKSGIIEYFQDTSFYVFIIIVYKIQGYTNNNG